MIRDNDKKELGIFASLIVFLFLCSLYFLLFLIIYAILFGWIVFGKNESSIPQYVDYLFTILIFVASIITFRRKFKVKRNKFKEDIGYILNSVKSTKIFIVIVLVALVLTFNIQNKTDNKVNEQTGIANCSREQGYENLPEFDRVLSLIKQREEEFANSPYSKIPGRVAPVKDNIFNCISIQYDSVRKDIGAEGYFIFDPSYAKENLFPIYVDDTYKSKDDLITATLVYHELTHVRQYLDEMNSNNGMDCMESEIDAFTAQARFMRYILNIEEQMSIRQRARSQREYMKSLKNPYYRPQLELIITLDELQDEVDLECPLLQADETCNAEKVQDRISEMVRSSAFYQEQCGATNE